MNLLFILYLHFVCYNERIRLPVIHYSIAKASKLETFEAPSAQHKYADRVSCTGAPKYFFIVGLACGSLGERRAQSNAGLVVTHVF